MAQISIGKSLYQINCKDGEEKKLQELAKRLNQKVNNLSLQLKNADEKTLLVLSALLLEEELEEAKSNNINIQENDNSKYGEDDLYDAISENMHNISDYIEKLITNIKKY